MRFQILLVLLMHTFWVHPVLAVSANISVRAVVPNILQANVVREDNLTYRVHELSNLREGYVVILETDAKEAIYEGHSIPVINGYAVLTRVTSQDRSVDVSKKLVLASAPSYLHISILPD